jgi:DNA polymerase III subunit delta
MPTIAAESLASELRKRKAGLCLLILGKDTYLRDVFRKQAIETSIDPATRDWALSRYSANEGEFANALAQARTVPMLAQRQVVIVSEIEALEEMPDEKRDAETKDLAEYLANPAPFTVLVLEAGHLDQRTKFAKMLVEGALVLAAGLPEDPQERARVSAGLATRMAGELNTSMDHDVAEELAELCNCDLGAMRSEIDKLATYAGAGRPIQRADIEALVVSERKYSVWELAEVLAMRQRSRAFHFLTNVLDQGEAAPALIGTMAWMFRKLIEAQSLSPRTSPYEAAGRLGMRAATAGMALQYARKIPRRQLVQGLRTLYDADSWLKGGATDDRAVMEFVVAQLTASQEAAPGTEPREQREASKR